MQFTNYLLVLDGVCLFFNCTDSTSSPLPTVNVMDFMHVAPVEPHGTTLKYILLQTNKNICDSNRITL